MKTTALFQVSPNRRLAWRMVVAILLLTISAAVIASACQIYLGYQQAVQQINSRYSEIEQGIFPNLTNALWTMDDTRIAAHLESVMSIRDVSYVRLEDELGQVRERHNGDSGTALSVRYFELYHLENNERHKVGRLEIAMSRQRAEQKLREIAQTTAITTLSILIVSAIVVLLLFHRWISRHLNQVANYAEQMTFTGLQQDLHLHRNAAKNPDELDIVVEAINQMRQRLQQELAQRNKAEQELLKHKDQLEQLVAERTMLLEQQTRQLQQQSAELAEQNTELNAYAHTVAHDLKHPLTSLIGFSTLLTQPQLQLHLEQQQNYILMIKESALKMNEIINSLLQLASVRSEADIDICQVDMSVCLNEAIQRLDSFAKEHQAEIHIEGKLPAAVGQRQWLEEVWVNYLSNAIKYGGAQPVIRAGAEVRGQMIRYWVRDPGPGVAAEYRDRLFKAFDRLDTLTSDGHGLGLSIVKRIVSKLQGEVGYCYSEETGSEFWFSLPVSPLSSA